MVIFPLPSTTIPQFNLESSTTKPFENRYGVLALEEFNAPSERRIPTDIQLRSVLLSKAYVRTHQPVELPKEIWEKLSRDKEIHQRIYPLISRWMMFARRAKHTTKAISSCAGCA